MEPLPLFVYGTLMSDQPAFGLFAACSTHYLRANLPNTQLYLVGPYPIATGGSGEIYGEIHWLAAPNLGLLLEELDRYEGDEYIRVRRLARLETDEEVAVWIYLGDPSYATQYPLIPSGDWRISIDPQRRLAKAR